MTALASMGVQIVLFDNDPAQQLRLAEGLATTLSRAKSVAGLEQVAVRWGDSSSSPCLSRDVAAELRRRLADVTEDVSVDVFGENLGSAGGSNALARLGSEEVIWVLNPDTYPSPKTAELMLEALARPGVGATEGRQLPVELPKEYDPATGDTEWASGCCMMVRRSVFEAVGGFDEHFFPMYCDDVDFSWRLRLAGHRIVYVPLAGVFHDKRVGDDGSVQISEFAVLDSARARLFLARRYGRPDVEQELRDWVAEHGTPEHRRAVAQFERRERAGDVPARLDGAESVATFLGADYAHHRYAQSVVVAPH